MNIFFLRLSMNRMQSNGPCAAVQPLAPVRAHKPSPDSPAGLIPPAGNVLLFQDFAEIPTREAAPKILINRNISDVKGMPVKTSDQLK